MTDEEAAALRHRSATARSWAVVLAADLAWVLGSAESAGFNVPQRITDELQEAVSWLATEGP